MKHYFLRSIILSLSFITSIAFAQNDESTPQEQLLQARDALNAVFLPNEPNQASSSNAPSSIIDVAEALSSLITEILESATEGTVGSNSFMGSTTELRGHLSSYFTPAATTHGLNLLSIGQIPQTIFELEELAEALLPLANSLISETISIFMIYGHWEYFVTYLVIGQQDIATDTDDDSFDSTDTDYYDYQGNPGSPPIHAYTDSDDDDDVLITNNPELAALMAQVDAFREMTASLEKI